MWTYAVSGHNHTSIEGIPSGDGERMDTSTLCYAWTATIARAAWLPAHLAALLVEYGISCARPLRTIPTHVLITGAASGMGRELAIHYVRMSSVA